MKERTRQGKFRRTESASYKMTQHHGFDAVSWQAFQEAAGEKYDFASSACPKGEKMVFGKCQKVDKDSDKDTKQASRVKRNLNKLDNQRRREKGLRPKKSSHGFHNK